MQDTLGNGHPFRMWAVQVRKSLEMLQLARRPQMTLDCDNGPQFMSQALNRQAVERGARLDFIGPSRPGGNRFIEGFNGRLRRVCVNARSFPTIAEARERIKRSRKEDISDRPHGSVRKLTPIESASWLARQHQ